MGWLSSMFGPPSRDKFAKIVLARLRKAGAPEPLTYNAKDFSIEGPRKARHFLANIHGEYCRADKEMRERLLTSSIRMWCTAANQIPEEFEDARPDLMPMTRSRCYLEVGLKSVQDSDKPFEIPHQVIADSLCAMIAYDLPMSMATINSDQLTKWGVTFYEAMEAAKQNLDETTKVVAQMGALYIVTHGDSYDSSRLLLTDRVRKLELDGDPIAMIPNRDTLFITGSESVEGLTLMAALAKEPLEKERSISGVALRLVDDEWEPWSPAPDHPAHQEFKTLRLQTVSQDYAEQKAMLEKQYERSGRDVFVASFSGVRHKETGAIDAYCVWVKDLPSLLPRTETIMFVAPGPDGKPTTVARGSWEHVEGIVGHLLEEQDLYPPRWFVNSFPEPEELKEIGVAD